ncbi:MFS transporter [Sphingomonas sp. IW22]|uniref:MFS transporter n=1 Tax=Sphingomonas sp. IW22 TaxID=3242489 RepID=UPI003522003F
MTGIGGVRAELGGGQDGIGVAPGPASSILSAGSSGGFDHSLARRIAAFGFVLIAEFFYGWAWNTVDVLRPFIRDSLGLTLTQAGSAYSAQGAGALVGAIAFGQLADRLGRRNMLVAIMVGYGVMLIAGVGVASYVQLLLQRFVLGLFLGGSFPVIVGIYVSLFGAGVRGRLASAINLTFSSAIVVLGLALGNLGDADWRMLLWLGGVPPVLLAALAWVIVPAGGVVVQASRFPIRELFAPAVRRRTLLLASLTGLNFFAYQAFSGWLTIYLKDVRLLDAEVIGRLVAAQFAGNMIGGFAWGWASDRLGRRFAALGFVMAAVSIAIYLTIPSIVPLLIVVGFAYGFGLSSSVVWGPWLAELYPPHLKSTAASIFNWGRLISFFAPLVTGALAAGVGLRAAMLVACLIFLVAAMIWRSLPETLTPRTQRG